MNKLFFLNQWMYKCAYLLAAFSLHSAQESEKQHPKTTTKQIEICLCSKHKLHMLKNNEGFHSNLSSVVQIDDFRSVLLYNDTTDIL